ncbi:MAG: HDOD domain-containing protein [Proteobacteria bacterium]|nr:HDOD domain-containing protein [Pseudomonadota bacterium]
MELTDPVIAALGTFEDEGSLRNQAASQSLAARIAKVEGLRTFPVVAKRAMDLLQSSDFKISKITRVIKEDPSLAAGVLRLANTAFFFRGKSVVSIDQAVVRLGRNSVRNVVMAVATMGMFPDVRGHGKAVRDHCSAVAAIAHTLAVEFSPADSEGIFLCGLLHDVGKMLLIESAEVVYTSEKTNDIFESDKIHLYERSVIGYDHAVLGGQVLWQWQLADPLPQVVAWHHQPDLAYKDSAIGPSIALLRIADFIDYHLQKNQGEPEDEFFDELAAGPDCSHLNITAENLKNNWSDFCAARDESLALFGG